MMKKILKMALLLSAAALATVGCKDPDEENESLIGIWTIESMSLKSLTFYPQVPLSAQEEVRTMLDETCKEMSDSAVKQGGTFEFTSSGELIARDNSSEDMEGTYTVEGNILTLSMSDTTSMSDTISMPDETMSGTYSISGRKLYFDYNLPSYYDGLSLAFLGIKEGIVRFTFNKK